MIPKRLASRIIVLGFKMLGGKYGLGFPGLLLDEWLKT